MDWKKVLLACFIFAGIATAAGQIVIGTGTLPTADATVKITKEEETAIKQWFTKIEGDIDTNFTVSELVCDGRICEAKIHKEGLVKDSVWVAQNYCKLEDTNHESGECLKWTEHTTQELADARNAGIKARLEIIAGAAEERLASQAEEKEAKVGAGKVTVNTK